MRIISQNKEIDLPYELCKLHISTKSRFPDPSIPKEQMSRTIDGMLTTYIILAEMSGESEIMAEYNQKEKALKVLSDIRYQHEMAEMAKINNSKPFSGYYEFPKDSNK